jgi:hypothetical protein
MGQDLELDGIWKFDLLKAEISLWAFTLQAFFFKMYTRKYFFVSLGTNSLA